MFACLSTYSHEKLLAYKVSRKADAALVIDTFYAAVSLRKPPKGLIVHSDRGPQYTSSALKKVLDEANVMQSFSAKAYPYDNAVAEAFFKYLKCEELNRHSYSSTEELDLAMSQYARFYNNERPHSANDGLTPNDRESSYAC
ncbi:hypothetical protein FACS1894111_12160 [Clostridia bacterium]|nr:hypothetical protein FACS1894111_12160 [Clostridia bacterium]